jgi:hypothetical protein
MHGSSFAHRAKEAGESFEWVSQMSQLLVEVIGTLAFLHSIWDTFMRDGRFQYFQEPDMKRGISKINDDFIRLNTTLHKLITLQRECQTYSSHVVSDHHLTCSSPMNRPSSV